MLSISDVRAALGSNPRLEEFLEQYRQSVIKLWERRTGRTWEYSASNTQVFQSLGTGVRSLWLPNRPVASITSVQQFEDSNWATLASTDYFLLDDSRLDRIDGDLFEGVVKVTYAGGYTADNLPYDVKTALLTQIKFVAARFASDKIILKTEGFEGGASSFETADLHPYFKAQAAHYRRIV